MFCGFDISSSLSPFPSMVKLLRMMMDSTARYASTHIRLLSYGKSSPFFVQGK